MEVRLYCHLTIIIASRRMVFINQSMLEEFHHKIIREHILILNQNKYNPNLTIKKFIKETEDMKLI